MGQAIESRCAGGVRLRRVSWVNALIGLKLRLPHSSLRMSRAIGALKPAFMNSWLSALSRGVRSPLGSLNVGVYRRGADGPLLREHGVLAPNAKLRALAVPQEVPQEPEPADQESKLAEWEASCAHHRPVRLSRAKLLQRVFDLDLEHCPSCGGELKILAAMLEQPVIEKVLTHLGLQARAPPRSAARGHALQAA